MFNEDATAATEQTAEVSAAAAPNADDSEKTLPATEALTRPKLSSKVPPDGPQDISEPPPHTVDFGGQPADAAPPREGELPRPAAVPTTPVRVTQAAHVVLWHDAQGVHVAPAGTPVSAIRVEAILVAVDPTTDLTSWLTPPPKKSR